MTNAISTIEGQDPRPFRISVAQYQLDDLASRLERTRWPDGLPGVGWSYGVDPAFLRELVNYWQAGYDWRAHERALNAIPQFLTEIDGQTVHFGHIRSSQPDAVPLLLTHGWPSTFGDFAAMIGPLTEPAAHGAPGSPAFHVVIPSVPGYGFSGPTHECGWDITRIGRAWVALMARLEYPRYLVQGGDWGSLISPAVAAIAPENVIGVHINAMINGANIDWSSANPTAGLSSDDIAKVVATEQQWSQRRAYADLQSSRPQTLAYALNDSPVGLLAWILDLEWAVGEDRFPGETSVDWDAILTVASIYWFTETAGSSARIYKEHGDWSNDAKAPAMSVPTAVAVFPGDCTLRSLAERHHHLVRFTEFDRGGHFAALQAPDLLVGDIRAFYDQIGATVASGTDLTPFSAP
jgi:pimeloyl-ACP methyl ester carboxylesterase